MTDDARDDDARDDDARTEKLREAGRRLQAAQLASDTEELDRQSHTRRD